MRAADLNPWVIVPMVVLICVAGVALALTLYPGVKARIPLRWKARIGLSLQGLYLIAWMSFAATWLKRKPFGDLGNVAMVVLIIAATGVTVFRVMKVFMSPEDMKTRGPVA